MLENKNIDKVLTTEAITVRVHQKLSYVNKIFNEKGIHHLPVLEGKKPIGIISTTDIYKLIYNIDMQDKRKIDTMLDNDFTIEDVMSKDLVTLPLSSTIKDAAGILQVSTRHSIIITNRDGEFAGIVTSTDLIKYLFNKIY
ncbi:MAG: CBS domain-containing protein [Candidatus Dadabacteria bacterium]|nr:CBS domain-containing protein [Candidatus Dadabacteria bacterium]NIQ16103.1 CBS domain-containing protein [Candidatus Dadabacteria bacterium]